MTGIIIQARMGSTRLPGKVLMKIGDKPLLAHIFDRLSALQTPECKFVVATSVNEENDAIEEFCREKGVTCFRGSEDNVLERYWLCAQEYGFDDIVRLTADNPFIDIEELDRLIRMHRELGVDYSYSDTELPEGLGAEIFSREALKISMEKAYKENHFEHVDDYILENMSEFACYKLALPPAKVHPEISFTVDTEAEYKKACYLAKHASDSLFSTEEAIRLEQEFKEA